VFDLYLTKAQLKELSQHPLITIGSHGLSHTCMSCMSEDAVRAEMVKSKLWLENVTRAPCDILVLPYGDPANRGVTCVKLAGYRRVVTTKPALNVGDNPGTIHRFMCDGLSVSRLEIGDWSG
jgi:peptidoglycan/xylan/chitin deacetylase (PgdA/CDA1 family)